MIARFLAESRKEEAASDTADQIEQEVRLLIRKHPQWQRKLLLISNDTPGVKVLRGKNRRQVLMKMLVSRETDELISFMTEMARREYAETEVWFEVNPTTMM